MTGRPPPLTVRCPAKLNLYLEVVRRRPDGYHDLDTIMQAIDLFDELEVVPRRGPELTLECSDASVPADARNLVVRAALALRRHTGHAGGAHFRLAKRIPAGAGLGGGSSDAAGALVALNRLWGLGLSTARLTEVAAAVGSDVAFFLTGGTARCTGRGEQVEPLPAPRTFHYVLVCPALRVSTAGVYARVRFPLTPRRADAIMPLRELASGDVEGLGRALFNRLEAPAFLGHPSLANGKACLAASGNFVGVAMTGSGSALFGVCRAADRAVALERTMALHLGQTHGVRSLAHGARLVVA